MDDQSPKLGKPEPATFIVTIQPAKPLDCAPDKIAEYLHAGLRHLFDTECVTVEPATDKLQQAFFFYGDWRDRVVQFYIAASPVVLLLLILFLLALWVYGSRDGTPLSND